MKVVPAVLAEDYDNCVRRMRLAESFADYVQIDVMDGVFVDTRSFDPGLINSLVTTLSFEIHMMVEDPAAVAEKIHNRGLSRIIFHFESRTDHAGLAKEIRSRGLSPGLAVRPETTLDMILKTAEHFDALLFLTVNPGRYGGAFLPEEVKKVSEARRTFPEKTIGVDGGVSLDNIGILYEAGVDYVCVGSRIFMGGRPEDNYGRFIKRLEELRHPGINR